MTKKQVGLVIFACICITTFFSIPAQALDIKSGDIITAEDSPLYYVGFDGKIHSFPNAAVYHSWFVDFEDVAHVEKSVLAQYQIGWPICVRPGTWLITFAGADRIYAAEPGCGLRPLRGEVEAFILFGKYWNKRVVELDTVHKSFYRIRGFENSKSSLDTDGDGVSDYEEEIYWATDVEKKDTDGDGVSDRDEIFAGYSPLGSERISALGKGVYVFPFGSIAAGLSNSAYYYKSTSGNVYTMNKNTYTGGNLYNGFSSQFLIHPAFEMSFSERQKAPISVSEKRLFFPTVKQAGKILLQ